MKSVSFIHLDLGIGGAENLVVNAANGLQERGFSVALFTAHHDKSRAFQQTVDGTLKVHVYGAWIPRQILGRFTVCLAIIRMWYICMAMLVNRQQSDIVITDQVSVANVAVRLLGLAKEKLLFYCHYPDVLLCTDRSSFLKRMYRVPFDWMEKQTTSMCDVLLVNSQYTAETLRATFPSIRRKVHVLYPPVDTGKVLRKVTPRLMKGLEPFKYFLSLNRFERKKDLLLVIDAFAAFSQSSSSSIKLVVAGGFDPRLRENVEYFSELENVVSSLGLSDKAFLVQNVSDDQRSLLLEKAKAVIYSPQYEHFGIVPCEAMLAGTPVIAWNNGGPKESILDGKTGHLCNEKSQFASFMFSIVSRKPEEAVRMSKACKERVHAQFSLQAFTDRLVYLIQS